MRAARAAGGGSVEATLGPRALARARHAACVVLAGLMGVAGAPIASAAQDIVTDVTLSADTVGLGDLFDLRFSVSLGPGEVLFLPDSLEARGFESFAPVEWSVAAGSGGGMDVAVTYPLIAFEVGPVDVAEIDLFLVPARQSVAAGFSREGDRVGSWDAFIEEPARVSAARIATVPAERVQVNSVLVIEDMTEGIRPRPAADVLGGDRDWVSTLLALVLAAVFSGALGVAGREWLAAARRRDVLGPPDPRLATIRALDELLIEGLHRAGRIRDFYGRSSTIVRRYVEGFESFWGPSWTSTELMTDLTRAESHPAGELPAEMSSAELVKFAGERPDPATAETHLAAVRGWVAASATDGPPEATERHRGEEPA